MTEVAPLPTPPRAPPPPLPGISCVVIGRNEGARLRSCFEAIRRADYPTHLLEVIYVDSASTDTSVQIAREYADQILVARLPRPRPGLARNLGWREARFDLVHFIDGDTAVNPGWFRQAARALESADVFAVFGRLEESRPRANLYHRAHDVEWKLPLDAEPRTSGGTVLVRSDVFGSLGGFDVTLEAGEEPELCTRARLAGWRLVYLDRPMARHDLAMSSLAGYWRRGVRCGYAYARIGLEFRASRIPMWWRELTRSLLQLGTVAAFLVAGGLAVGWLAALASLVAALAVLVGRKMVQVRGHGGEARARLVYALHVYLVKLPVWAGHLRFFLDRLRPEPPPLPAIVLERWRREEAPSRRTREAAASARRR